MDGDSRGAVRCITGGASGIRDVGTGDSPAAESQEDVDKPGTGRR